MWVLMQRVMTSRHVLAGERWPCQAGRWEQGSHKDAHSFFFPKGRLFFFVRGLGSV